MPSKETTAAAARGCFSLPPSSVGLAGSESEPYDEHTLPGVRRADGLSPSIIAQTLDLTKCCMEGRKPVHLFCSRIYSCLGCIGLPFCCSTSLPYQLMAAHLVHGPQLEVLGTHAVELPLQHGRIEVPFDFFP
jgi:hypothetical protein